MELIKQKKQLEAQFSGIILESSIHKNVISLKIEFGTAEKISKHFIRLGYSLANLFAVQINKPRHPFVITYLFSDVQTGCFISLSMETGSAPEFPSIAVAVPSASQYEREIHDLFGLFPIGHPDPKRLIFHHNWPKDMYPMRDEYPSFHKPEWANEPISFKEIFGTGIFEIPVGPVHAGIIEPGHFRFSLAGEPILNLEAQLYFVHKGIEKLCQGKTIEHCYFISERISGDETIANSMAYCQAIEAISDLQIPMRAAYTRVIFAELERLISHFGDLAGVCTDVAYGFAASQFNMIRDWCFAIADILCGRRFMRSVNQPGGIRKDFLNGKEAQLIAKIKEIEKELHDTENIVMQNSLFADRIENTGILKSSIANDLHAVGPAARASGIQYDVRRTFPYAAYGKLALQIPVMIDGDVNSRVKVKLFECYQSIQLICDAAASIPDGPIHEEIPHIPSGSFGYGIVESPRGENIHYVKIGENNTICRYKIRTPSFCNWPALCHAVQGNIVPDFPLINKSFNLSYAGNDL